MGESHTIILTGNNECYGFGLNNYNQIDNSNIISLGLTKLKYNPTKIKCSMFSSYFIY